MSHGNARPAILATADMAAERGTFSTLFNGGKSKSVARQAGCTAPKKKQGQGSHATMDGLMLHCTL